MFPLLIDIQKISLPMKDWWGSISKNHASGWDGIWVGGHLVLFLLLLSWNQIERVQDESTKSRIHMIDRFFVKWMKP